MIEFNLDEFDTIQIEEQSAIRDAQRPRFEPKKKYKQRGETILDRTQSKDVLEDIDDLKDDNWMRHPVTQLKRDIIRLAPKGYWEESLKSCI
eukprot:UN04940